MLCGKTKHKRKALSSIDINLKILSQKYRFSSKELSQYSCEFKNLCQNSAGFTLAQFRKNMGPLGLESTRLISDRIFAVMNKSKSGSVILKEYLEYMDILMHGTAQEKLSQSFRLITQDQSPDITYSQFESWIISAWKMYNILTGTEISATKDNIRQYFEKLDAKGDGVVDFEEFKESLGKHENLGVWLEIVNREISEKLNLHQEFNKEKSPRLMKSPKSFKRNEENFCIENLENDISFCIAEIAKISEERKEEKEISKISPRSDSPEILIGSSKVEMLVGDDDSLYSFADYSDIRYNNPPMQDSLEKISSRLESALSGIKFLKSLHASNKESQPQERLVSRMQNSIRWGDSDWNLIMNMMIGIQKSTGSLLQDLPTEISTEEFLSKCKHQLLPVKFARNSYKFTDYAPVVFHRIRKLYGISNSQYTKSLGVEKIVQSLMANEFSSLSGQCSSGKSGSFFFYSEDGKFMLKTITISEYELLRKALPDYYFHLTNNPQTLLTRFYGLHKITGNSPLYFVVMSNLFRTSHEIHFKFDLKGSRYGRNTDPSADKSIARKDLDFNSKICIGRERKSVLISQIERDTELLQRLKIIDYSLLLGIHELQPDMMENQQYIELLQRNSDGMLSTSHKEFYFMGIIDFLTKFGAKKKFEHFVMGALHGRKEVSCVPPINYCKRFTNYIESIIE